MMNFTKLKIVSVLTKKGSMLSIQEDFGQEDDPDLSVAGCYNPSSKGEAYAKLFASAPDLLEALQEISLWVDVNCALNENIKYPHDKMNSVFAAIAKARGE